MSRIGESPDNAAASELRDLRLNIDTLRSASQRVGAKNIISYITSSANAYDVAITVAPGTGTYVIHFTAGRQQYAIAEMYFRMYIDSMSSEIKVNDAAWPFVGVDTAKTYSTGGAVYQWTFSIYNSDTVSHTYYTKVQVVATDTGAIS